MESAIKGNIGFSIESDEEIRKDAFLFGESQSRVVVSVHQEMLDGFIELVLSSGVEFTNLGEVGGKSLMVDGVSLGDIDEYQSLYVNSIANRL